MPGKSLFHDAARAGRDARPPAGAPVAKVLYAVDAKLPRRGTVATRGQAPVPHGPQRPAVLPAASPAPGIGELTAAAGHAVAAGHGHVLGTSHVVFPNGAITLLLILAESHLAIHTWPEEDRIAVDLFSCGAIDAERVIADLAGALRLADVRTQRLDRS